MPDDIAFGTMVAKSRYRKAKSTGDMALRSPHKVNFAGALEEKAGNRIALEKKKEIASTEHPHPLMILAGLCQRNVIDSNRSATD